MSNYYQHSTKPIGIYRGASTNMSCQGGKGGVKREGRGWVGGGRRGRKQERERGKDHQFV
jgi:hypothetical protein